MEYRKAELNDIPQINELYRQFYQYHAKLQPAYCRPATESGNYPKQIIESPDADIIVAAEKDVICGFAHLSESQTLPYPSIIPHRYALLVDLYVLPERRKLGIGNALMAACKAWALERNLEYLELKVLAENAIALSFYQQQGFTPAYSTLRLKI